MGKGGSPGIWGVTGTLEGQACLSHSLQVGPQWIQRATRMELPALDSTCRNQTSGQSSVSAETIPPRAEARGTEPPCVQTLSLPRKNSDLYLGRKFTKSWRALSPNFPQSSCDLPPSPVGPAGRGGGSPVSYTKQGPWTKGVTWKLTRKAESGAHFPRMYRSESVF